MTAYLLAAIFFALMLRLAWDVGDLLGEALERCICRKGAVHPECPRHGWARESA